MGPNELPRVNSVNLLRMKDLIARKYVISGRVQGVGFRYFAQRAARELGVTGWARNLDDGRVEVHANGVVKVLDEFEGRLRKGPMGSDVRGFEMVEAGVIGGSGFHIR
jgi:acylphosphatase